jgi:hypothetical protein
MSKPEGYVPLDEDLERAAKASAPPQFAPQGAKVHHAPSLLSLQGISSAIPKLPGEDPVLTEAAQAFAEDEQHKSPMLDGGDLPLRALAQGLSMLSLDELRRLRLPAMPWQAGDGPSMWEGLKKTPWKAHYTNFMGFLISTGARAAQPGSRCARRALTPDGAQALSSRTCGRPSWRVCWSCLCRRRGGAPTRLHCHSARCGAACAPATPRPGRRHGAGSCAGAHCACSGREQRLSACAPSRLLPRAGLLLPQQARLPHE